MMDQFENSAFVADLSNEQLVNNLLMLIDSISSPHIVGQTPSPAISNTPLQSRTLEPSFSPLNQVQQPIIHHTAFPFDLYSNMSPPQIQPLESPPATVSNNDQPSEQNSASSSMVRRSTRGTNRPKNFQCSQCPRLYDRSSRAQTCENNHLGIKRYRCGGRCGQPLCPKKYASPSGLDRHCLPNHERAISCVDCGRKITRHNMARHQRICVARL